MPVKHFDIFLGLALGIPCDKAKLNLTQVCYSLFVILLLSFTSWYLEIFGDYDTQSRNRLSYEASKLQGMANYLISFLIIILSYCSHASWYRQFKLLNRIDEDTSMNIDADVPSKFIIEMVLLFNFLSVDSYFYIHGHISLNICMLVTLVHSIFVSKLLVYKFKENLYKMRKRFEVLSKRVEHNTPPILLHLSTYNLLTDISTDFSRNYGFGITFILFCYSCLFISQNFQVIDRFYYMWVDFSWDRLPNYPMLVYQWATNSLYAIYWLSTIWSLVSVTAPVINKAASFNKELLKILEHGNLTHEEREKIQLHLALKKLPQIDGHGFCSLDYTYLYNLGALTASYLVILTQFKT